MQLFVDGLFTEMRGASADDPGGDRADHRRGASADDPGGDRARADHRQPAWST